MEVAAVVGGVEREEGPAVAARGVLAVARLASAAAGQADPADRPVVGLPCDPSLPVNQNNNKIVH